jgi:hypothetical protein
MAQGKYLSLEEARKLGKLDQFAREHEIKPEAANPPSRFDRLLDAMAGGKPATADQTLNQDASED